jgi:hypothetical protein
MKEKQMQSTVVKMRARMGSLLALSFFMGRRNEMMSSLAMACRSGTEKQVKALQTLSKDKLAASSEEGSPRRRRARGGDSWGFTCDSSGSEAED